MAISETRGVPIVSEQQIPNGVVVRGDIVAPKPPHLFALVCVFVGIGLAFLFGQVGLPVAGLAFAMLAFLVALITYAQRSQVGRNRATIRVTETGFIVFDRNGTAAYSVEGVAAVALDETVRFTNGVAAGIRRKGTLVVIGEFATRAISMDYFVAMGEPDPVAPLLHRVLVLGLARANETLLAGEKFLGIGWSMDREGLRVAGKRSDTLYRYEDLAGARIADGKLSIWECGKAAPTLSFASGSMNARVLEAALNQRIVASAPKQLADKSVGDGLGRLIFRRARHSDVRRSLASWLPLSRRSFSAWCSWSNRTS